MCSANLNIISSYSSGNAETNSSMDRETELQRSLNENIKTMEVLREQKLQAEAQVVSQQSAIENSSAEVESLIGEIEAISGEYDVSG